MKNIRFTALLIVSISFAIPGYGQGEISPLFLNRTLQANILNPAMNDGSRVAIGLPSTSLMLSHTGFSFSDVIKPVPGQPDSTYLAIDDFVGLLGDDGVFKLEAREDWFSLAIGGKRVRILSGLSSRSLSEFSYPVDAFRLAWNGNGAYLDEPLQLGPSFRTMNWWEAYVGAQVGIGDRITVGGKIKYLGGLLYAGNSKSQVDFTTYSDGYDVEFDVDYEVQLTGPGLTGIDWQSYQSIQAFDPNVALLDFGKNRGVGVDLGVVFRPIESVEVGASVLDLGQIVWRSNVTTLAVKGDFRFEGINVTPFFSGDSIDLQGIPDSLLSRFSFTESSDAIRTGLPTRYVIHGAWEPVSWLRLHSAIQLQQFIAPLDFSWALGAQLRAGKWLDVGMSYQYRPDVGNLIGLQSSVKLGPVVLYVMSDHALAALLWRDTQLIHFRGGMNFQIGKQTSRGALSRPAERVE